jgi:hypothetical protein
MKLTIAGVALACLTVGAAVSLRADQAASCAPSGGLNFICGVQNPEDLVLVPNTRWMLASGMGPGSGLHLIDTRAKKATTVYGVGTANARADKTKFANCPGPLDPKAAVLHGLSLRANSNARHTVYATNHGGRESVEVFEFDAALPAPTATWIGCVVLPNGLAANSVQDVRRCLCAAEHGSCTEMEAG